MISDEFEDYAWDVLSESATLGDALAAARQDRAAPASLVRELETLVEAFGPGKPVREFLDY